MEDSKQNERIARMEEKIENTNNSLQKLEVKFDKHATKGDEQHREVMKNMKAWANDIKTATLTYVDNASTSKVRDLGAVLFASKATEKTVNSFITWWLSISGGVIVILVILVAILIRTKANVPIPFIE